MKKIAVTILVLLLQLLSFQDFAKAEIVQTGNTGKTVKKGKIVIKIKGEKKPRLLKVPRGRTEKSFIALKLKSKNVQYAERDYIVRAFGYPNDPLRQYQWHLSKTRAEQAREITNVSTVVKIAIVDTGVTLSHPELVGRIEEGYDFVNYDNDPSDDHGHGTAVAGTAAAKSDNGKGVASLAGFARIIPVKVLDESGSGDTYGVSSGIIYAADAGANVINLSLGGPYDSSAVRDAVNYAQQKGCVVVAAAGNDGMGANAPQYPASNPGVISVASTSSSDQPSDFSNHDSNVDVSAPGEDILTTFPGGYGYFSGTSAASPQVAALAAFVKAKYPNLSTPADIESKMKNNAKDLGTRGRDDYFGSGRIDSYHSVSGSPYVVGTNPESDGIAGTRTIRIGFSETISGTGLSRTLKMRDEKGRAVALKAQVIKNIVSIKTAPLAKKTYYLTINGIKTSRGTGLAGPYTFRFRTNKVIR